MNNFLKNTVFCILCLFLSNHLFAQLSEPKDNMEGVKTLNIYLYKVYDVETKKDEVTFYKKAKTIAHSLFEYDTNGNQILHNYYHQETDKVQESYVYEYDSNNRMTQETYVLQGQTLGGKTIYTYNKQGKIFQTAVYSNKNEIKSLLISEYDSIGNLVAESSRNVTGTMLKEIRYRYDERNNLVEKKNIQTILKNNEPYRETQSFDDSNRLIIKTRYDDKDSLIWQYTAKYDEKNRLIEEETKDGKGKVTAYSTYIYDKNDLMILSYNFDVLKKIPPMRIEYKYDKKGLNTLRYIYLADSKTPTTTKRYYYDEKGNWYMWYEINHTDNIQAIANRKITYF